MLTLTDLMRRHATTGEHRFAVTEVFFHERTGQLRYVALRTGDAFEHDDTLVSAGRFSPVGDGDWKVYLAEADIRAAPGWNSGESHRIPVALEAWPPIIVGPFGETTSPLMFYAAMLEAETGAEPAPPSGRRADARVDRLERATRRLGGEVFGADGFLGRLDDMVVAPVGLAVTDLVVDGRHVPYARLRHMADEGTHTVLDIDRATVEALPRTAGEERSG